MEILDLFSLYTVRLEHHKIEYIVTGSVASIVYGEPRLTHDIDLVVLLSSTQIDDFISAFPSSLFYCPPKEIIINESKRSNRGHINLIHHDTGFKGDIYFAGKEDIQLWALQNKRTVTFLGKNLSLAPPEYVIIKKMEFYQEGNSQKHLNDIVAILRHSKSIINLKLLDSFLAAKKLESCWEEVKVLVRDDMK